MRYPSDTPRAFAGRLAWAMGWCLLWGLCDTGPAAAQSLEQRLAGESFVSLAAAARRDGDAARGAVVFYQPQMACIRCHSVGDQQDSLGPDLTRIDRKTSDAALVESVLEPSKAIATGYAAVTIETTDGRVLTGVPVEETAQRLVLRAFQFQPTQLVTIRKSEIADRQSLRQSLMPAGQVNQLADRRQFLDLVRYLIELRDGGALRARELRPAPESITLKLPDYERHIDHTRMIADLGKPNYLRGQAIYERVCLNCHGTPEQPGSLPTSLRFASGSFKNGSDPYAMYQTLTRGFGMMVPQTWMVPQQKYDVIHYIREEYLKPDNGSQYFQVTKAYLAGLPRGDTRGPIPIDVKPWEEMDYGPYLMNTYEVGSNGTNLAYKGIAVRLDPGAGGVTRGRAWMLFDHDTLRVAGAWTGTGFIDFGSVQLDGRHGVHPHVVGRVHLANPIGPGWGNPTSTAFEDPRLRGVDGKPYGPLPRDWSHYRGLYQHGRQVVISYTVGTTGVLEQPGLAGTEKQDVFTRTLNIGPRDRPLVMQVARHPDAAARIDDAEGGSEGARLGSAAARCVVFGSDTAPQVGVPPAGYLVAGLAPRVPGARWLADGRGNLRLHIPAGPAPLRFTLALGRIDRRADAPLVAAAAIDKPDGDLAELMHGGPARWPRMLSTRPVIGRRDGPWAVDVLVHPAANPWQAQLRFTGLDFLSGGRQAAVCTWDGDVWLVGDLLAAEGGLSWQRIASGLFQPLGLKIVAGRIYVTCRDQIVVLHDSNGDGETDFYESFNSDQQVTDHFHEFAMGLQTDAVGNFYYAKGARHALPALVPQHGTLLRVSPDGSRTDILATGFRAPNGVCVNPDGTFFVTDQEGHWLPKNRVNWVRPGHFYGNMNAAPAGQSAADSAMDQPVCWITNSFDRSPAEPLWVQDDRWTPLHGALLNLSYGYGKIHIILRERVGDRVQGGLCALDLPSFPTGLIRGRFNPADGQLYTCGMFAWAGSATEPGGLFRLRYTGGPVWLPVGLSARRGGLVIMLSDPVERESAADPRNYSIKTWSLKRTARYGSEHYHEQRLEVAAASLADDGRTVTLTVPKIAPTWCMEIKYTLRAAGKGGRPVSGIIHNTIHALVDPGMPQASGGAAKFR